MATSGLVGTTVVRINDTIDAALRRARIPAAAGTSETLQIGQRIAFTWLSSLPNHGPLQWTIESTVVGTALGRVLYTMPSGTVDLRNVLYRSMTRPAGTASSSAGGTATNAFDADTTTSCTQTSINGNISLNYGSGNNQSITTVGVMANGAQTYTLLFEYSSDGITWSTIAAPGETDYPDYDWVYFDISSPVSAQYFRVRETGGSTLDIRELYWGTTPSELPVSRMNQDDYTSLPNKTFQSSPITNFFVRRNAFSVQVYMWPSANTWFNQISVWRWRYPQDPGAVNLEFEIPQRWLNAMIAHLAYQMALEVGGQNNLDPKFIDWLRQVSITETTEAELEERDDSPIFFGASLDPYTS